MTINNLHKTVCTDAWIREIARLENELNRIAPCLTGGRNPKETIIAYVMRSRAMQNDLIDRLNIARECLKESTGK